MLMRALRDAWSQLGFGTSEAEGSMRMADCVSASLLEPYPSQIESKGADEHKAIRLKETERGLISTHLVNLIDDAGPEIVAASWTVFDRERDDLDDARLRRVQRLQQLDKLKPRFERVQRHGCLLSLVG